jgi:hypothetical protein
VDGPDFSFVRRPDIHSRTQKISLSVNAHFSAHTEKPDSLLIISHRPRTDIHAKAREEIKGAPPPLNP